MSFYLFQPKPYEFGYSVKDPHTGSDFKQQESSDGNTVKGQYKVLLPDGRTQIVTYTADWQSGFHADVKYEGEAIYPSNYGSGGHGGYGGGSGFGSGSYGVPSAGGYSGGGYSGGGDFNGGGGVATGSSYNNIGHGGGNGGYGDISGSQQYGVPGY